ncbi:MAG: FAD-dependent monooxygenase [Bryobacteraceae bacterium]|jgi:2-polyprenyl-6-methoxyphenol hydroxylase-like FAD-dependent oxidoreductase
MHYDVAIAGAGPVGLLLACELKLAGVSVLVLERLADPNQPIKAGGMGQRGLNVPSVETFYRRGLLPQVRAAALWWVDASNTAPQPARDAASSAESVSTGRRAPPAPKFAGHFAGITLDGNLIDYGDADFGGRGPAASGGAISMQSLEALLAQRAAELQVEIRRGVALTGFDTSTDGLTVYARDLVFHAGWLVGCDGGRSTVRKLAGFEFPGTDPEITGYSAMVDIADPEKLSPGWNRTAKGLYVHGPVPGRILIVEFDGPPADREAPITLETLQTSLRNVSGTDVTLTGVHVATSFTDNARQARTYRLGRVLLAGDAAHVHSPFGGQGLNLGIGDAMNLGWKLAATVKGWAPGELLDTYTAERHPIGEWALEWTRAQVALMRTEPHARALAAVVQDLIGTGTGATYFAKKISGVWQRYGPQGGHPLIGRSAPDLELEDGSRLGEYLRHGQAILFDLAGNVDMRELASRWVGRLRIVCARSGDRPDLTGLLVRPDGYVAWAAEGEPDLASAGAAFARWLGTARSAAA